MTTSSPAATPIPVLSAEGAPGEVFSGAMLPLRAFALILRTPKLLLLSLACAVVTGLTLLGSAWAAWELGGRFADWLLRDPASGWRYAASLGLAFVSFALIFAAFALTLPNLLLAPLQDPLSEATEARCGDFTPAPFSVGLLLTGTWTSLRHTLGRLVLMTIGTVVLLPLNLVPAVGSVAWAVTSSVWSMFWLTAEHLSNPMSRHLRPFRQVVRTVWRRKALSLGFGATLFVLLWVPVLNFFLMPVAVVAGTLLYRGLAAVNAFPPGNEDRSRALSVP